MEANRFSLRFTNSTNADIKILLEPWGEEHSLPRGATLTINAMGPEGDTLEVEYTTDGVTVYGWTGSTISTSVGTGSPTTG
jgi:hypothetical protein